MGWVVCVIYLFQLQFSSMDRAKASAPSRQRRDDSVAFVHRLTGMSAMYIARDECFRPVGNRSSNSAVSGAITRLPPGSPLGMSRLNSLSATTITGMSSCVYLFTVAYGVSFGPVGWVLPNEVFPLSMRGKGAALSTASNWLNNCTP